MKDGKVNLTKMVQIAKSASAVPKCNRLMPKIVFDPKISNLIINIMPARSTNAMKPLMRHQPSLEKA
jgi:hypothetical protein